MNVMDCTDIKALLSGLVDDELDAPSRHRAERHLAGCAPCRGLIDEAENLTLLLRAEADRDALADLPRGFAGAVLARTVHDDAGRRTGAGGWVNWLGWLAAAACLLLAISVWVMDHRTAPDAGAERRSVGASPLRVLTAHNLRSFTFDGELPHETANGSEADVAPDGSAPMAAPRRIVHRDDAETLDSAALLVEILVGTDTTSFVDVERVRRIAEYDGLVARLSLAAERLDAADRPAIWAVQSILTRIVTGPTAESDLRQMVESLREIQLSQQLVSISNRWRRAETI